MRSSGPAVLALALLGASLARLLSFVALEDVPHVMDEVAYTFQARTMALGHLSVPVAWPRAAFAMWFVDDRAARFSIFPPGWPAVLALGIKLRAMHWVNPGLHGATVLLVAAIARRMGGPRARLVAAAAYALSPQALLLAASLMSHTLVAFGAALALWGGVRARRSLVTAAFGVGLVFLARPLCGVVVAVGFLVLLALAISRGRARLPTIALAAVPLVVSAALLGAYNFSLTGGALRFPQTVWFDEHAPPLDDPFFHYHPGCNALGLGPGHGCDEGIKNATHDVTNALSNTGDNLTSWTVLAGGGPLVFLCAGGALLLRGLGRRTGECRSRSPGQKMRWALAVPIAVAILAYALYWYAGTCYGARFYHAALPSLVVLAALGAAQIWRRQRAAFVVVGMVWMAASALSMRLAFSEIADRYWGIDGRFAAVREGFQGGPPALVMVAFRSDGFLMHYLRWTSFTSHDPHSRWHNSVRALAALAENSPALDGPVVFAKYHPALVDELRARFPDRAVYIYVLDGRPEGDVLSPYEASPIRDLDRITVWPRDNFDGYVIPREEPR